MIKLIIFDIGGVIVNYTEARYFRYITRKLRLNYAAFVGLITPLIEQMELGRMRHAEVEDILARRFNIKRGQLEWASSFVSLIKPNKKVISLVNRLSDRYRVVLLTDISGSRFHELEKPVLSKLHVEKIYASFSIGMRKGDLEPKRWPYRYVIKKTGVRPSEALFIDNMEYNVKGAERIGIHGIVFKSYTQLSRKMRKLGVI
jgi:putative hydrolase of the HAD superfamily